MGLVKISNSLSKNINCRGKNELWYFVSILTSSNIYDNIRMNDRRLAIWQGAGYYNFTTSNSITGNVNYIINIHFPEDI